MASLEIARGRRARRRGLIGRSDLAGAMLIERCSWVHTVAMRFDIDVAYLDANGRVLEIVQMRPGRVGRPRPKGRSVVEAQSGAFDRWHIAPGDVLQARLDT